MTKKSLIVLSLCLLLGAGIALYVWAGCCPTDPLCWGGVSHQGSCNFYFTVYHDRDSGGGDHDVKLYLQKDGDVSATPYLMYPPESPPLPTSVLYHKLILGLSANSTYYYYFQCEDCSGRDPDAGQGTHTLLTGNCGG